MMESQGGCDALEFPSPGPLFSAVGNMVSLSEKRLERKGGELKKNSLHCYYGRERRQ